MVKTRVAAGGPLVARFRDRSGQIVEEWEVAGPTTGSETKFISLRCFR
jgi:hypothetical protein